MRRTDEEFKAEVFRRSENFKARRRKRGRRIVLACLPVLLCCTALLALSGGFGKSAESTANTAMAEDAAQSVECMDAPAAAMEEADQELGNGKWENFSDGTGSAGVVSVEVISQPESEDYARVFTDPVKTAAIVDAIRAFCEDPDTVIGGSETGDCEGMSYRIIVTDETAVQEYVLFNQALLDTEGIWYVNPGCYRVLEELILQESD